MKTGAWSLLAVLGFLAESLAQNSSGASFFGRKPSTSAASASPFSAPLMIDEVTPYPTPAAAIQALNRVAEEKYRQLTGDRISDLATVGEKGQRIAELAGYIVERSDGDGFPVFHVTELQQLSARGGVPRGVRLRTGEKVYGYHTGRHTDEATGVTILSNTDFKGLISSADEAEFVYDVAAQAVVGMDRQGNLFKLEDSGDWVDLSGQKSDFCKTGVSRYETTTSFLQSSETVDSGPACVPDSWSGDSSASAGTANTGSAYQTQTIDYTEAKGQLSGMLEGAYQYASGIAAEAGVSSEYQSAVAPVMSQGWEAISSIPDQQTTMMPAGTTSSGGYSSEIMDQVGRTFSEQGPCSAGFHLEAIKNQNQTP